ncbi:MAG TPA: hypothetical protein PKE45_22730, partial [Caldilineaceae bacterium]|nr:hypothetical protein [Caldilineaceae bacterium]
AAQQVVTDYSMPGVELKVTPGPQIDGEPAYVVDHVPGQDFTRRVLVAHDGLLYELMFLPADPDQPEAFAEMEALYAAVVDSLRFIPLARYSGELGLVWQGQVEGEQGEQCQELRLLRNTDALIGPCDEAGAGVQLGGKLAQEWAEIQSIFAPFEFESPRDHTTFNGSGQTGSVAWQHAITAWARGAYQTLASGKVTAAGNTVLSWWLGEVPEHPGYCNHLLVLDYGYAYIRVDPCAGGGAPIALAESWLQTDELEPFDQWLQQRAPLYQGDNYFSGFGTTEMSADEVAALADWAQQVYRRIEQATPSYLEAAAASAVGPTGRIVFGSRRSGDMDIYSMAPDGTDLLQLSSGETFDAFPTPSPDGSRIAFVAETMD